MTCPSCRRPVARTALRQAREARGEAQDSAAYALRVTPVTLGRWERGVTDIRLANRQRIAAHFGAALSEVAGWVDPPCPRCAPASGAGPTPEDAAPASLRTVDTGDVVKVEVRTLDGRIVIVSLSRRQFGELFAAGGLAAFVPGFAPDEVERVAGAVSSPARVDDAVVVAFEEQLGGYRVIEQQLGAQRVLPMLRQQLGLIKRLVSGARSPVRERLVSVGSRYSELGGWLHRDAGDQAQAARWYDRAVSWSSEAGSSSLAGFLLVSKSLQARDQNNPDGMVELARAARRPSLAPTLRLVASSLTNEANGHALAGDGEECLRRLDQAAELCARGLGSEGEPAHMQQLSEAKLRFLAARCLLEAGYTRRAVDAFGEALAEQPAAYTGDYAYGLALLGIAHANNREPDQATEVGMTALPLATEIGSARTLAELKRLEAALTPWSSVPAVTEFRQALRTSA